MITRSLRDVSMVVEIDHVRGVCAVSAYDTADPLCSTLPSAAAPSEPLSRNGEVRETSKI